MTFNRFQYLYFVCKWSIWMDGLSFVEWVSSLCKNQHYLGTLCIMICSKNIHVPWKSKGVSVPATTWKDLIFSWLIFSFFCWSVKQCAAVIILLLAAMLPPQWRYPSKVWIETVHGCWIRKQMYIRWIELKDKNFETTLAKKIWIESNW